MLYSEVVGEWIPKCVLSIVNTAIYCGQGFGVSSLDNVGDVVRLERYLVYFERELIAPCLLALKFGEKCALWIG